MALPLATAKMTSKKKGTGKVISEYGGKAAPAKKGPFSGASDRLKRKGGKGPAKGTGRR